MSNRGVAQTDKFLLGSASVMVGPLGSLATLTEDNSLGLVKDITLEFNPTFTDLQQGIQNNIVYSVRTGQETRLTGTSYEFTDKNVAYAAGINGDEVEVITGSPYVVSAAAAGTSSGTTTLTVNVPTTPVTLVQNDWVVVHGKDFSTITQVVDVTDIATGALTLSGEFHALVTADSKVMKVNLLELGRNTPVQYVCAKIVGELPNGDAVVMEVPKCQFTSGLSLAFTTQDFSNMALELRPTALVKSDGDYANYGDTLIRVGLANNAA